MPAIALLALVAALVAIHLWGSFRASMTTLIFTTFLIPGAVTVPQSTGNVTILRVGLILAIVGVVTRLSRGELSPAVIRPTRVFAALALFVVLAYLLGVSQAPYPSRPNLALDLWLTVLDQLLFLWLATIAVRVLGVRAVAMMAAVATVLIALIGIGEREFHWAYAHYWFESQPTRLISAGRLELRGRTRRVRASADFSLEFAWVLAYFMPLVALFAIRAKRIAALVFPVVVVVAFVFTVTRSAFAGLALGGLALVITARGDKRILVTVALAGIAAGVLYLGASSIRTPYQAASPESANVRARRLVLVTQEMATKPWFGLGLDGLGQRGIRGTDNAYLSSYAAVGVVGLSALLASIAAAGVTAGFAAARGDEELAPLAGAVVGGLVVVTLGMFAFDTFNSPLSAWSVWLLAALGIGLYEEVQARSPSLAPRPIQLNRSRLVLPAAGLVTGLVLWVIAPSHVAVQLRFFTLSPQYLTVSKKPNDDYIGRFIVETICDVGERAVGPKITVDCFDPLTLGPGTGVARLEARNRALLTVGEAAFVHAALQVPNTRLAGTSGAPAARPTWARTAPITGLLGGGEAALLLPTFRLRRRRFTRRHSPGGSRVLERT